MTLNTSGKAIVEHRRLLVARLRLRGFTQREIVDKLAQMARQSPPVPGSYNDKDGKPWALGTINGDLKAAEEEWKALAARAIGEHKANVLAEIAEVKRAAWADKDYKAVLAALRRECDLMGLDEPDRLEVYDWRKEAEKHGIDASALFEELVSDIAGKLEASGDS